MLFRKSDGTLLEINKYDYKNDHIYYNKIMSNKSLNINNNHIDKKKETYTKNIINKLKKSFGNSYD